MGEVRNVTGGAAGEGTGNPIGLAQKLTGGKTEDGLVWYDIRELGVEGRGWDETRGFYDRLPAHAEGLVRPPVWLLAQHSAGMCVRFVTDAAGISARWRLRFESLAMDHMPSTGVSGLDLYARLAWGWRFVGTGRRPKYPDSRSPLVEGLASGKREYRLHLPLYNGVESVEVGIPEGAVLARAPGYSALASRPMVFYGTSIVQGGCASRPGMAYPAILGRMLDRPHVNLGFSGNGKSEPELAHLMAEIDASVYVLDALPNMSPEMVAERIEPFVTILREARARTPIVLVENVRYQGSAIVPARLKHYSEKNAELASVYRRLRSSGVENLDLVPCAELYGDDDEATVDGTHATDVGFRRMARALALVLMPLI